LVLSASLKIAVLRSPSSNSEYLKKHGMMNTGIKRDTTNTRTIDVTAKTGTRALPADSMIQRNKGSMITVNIAVKRNVLILSITNVPIVVLLKPYFSSMTKVLYKENGMLIMICRRVSKIMNRYA